MTVTALVGAQYGSEGKGVVAARLAPYFDIAVRTGGPNAGHSFYHDGKVWKMRQIPCAWINPKARVVIGAGGIIDPVLLAEEIKATRVWPMIDRHAVVIDPEFREAEEIDLVGRIGSTGEGVGQARIHKILRDPERVRLAGEVYAHSSYDTVEFIWSELNKGKSVMLEGTQGSGLSLHHGKWPYVTSNDTNAAQLLADAGIAPDWLLHTLLVARTHPIRVAGNSGPLLGEHGWDQIPGITQPERTTVTNKVRRIGIWDHELFYRAVQLNEPCGIALTFADYLDPDIREKSGPHEWNEELRELIYLIEQETPVVLVGVGGEQFSMVPYHRCAHGDRW